MDALRYLCVCDVLLSNASDLRSIGTKREDIRLKSSNLFSNYNLKQKTKSCRACVNYPSNSPQIATAKGEERSGECTYGDHNSQWLSLELQRLLSVQKKPSGGIILTRGQWKWPVRKSSFYHLRGIMRFHNVTESYEVFIPEVQGRLRLFSTECLDGITASIQIVSRHPGSKPAPRNDGYWPVYIIRAGESTSIEVVIEVEAKGGKSLKDLQAIRVEIDYITYGPHGRLTHLQHAILPLQYTRADHGTISWQMGRGTSSVLPVPTHLLSHLDDPVQVIKTYILPHAKPGDVIAISETPLAIMQGRFRHPHGIHPGLLACLVCRLFHPTSSLATACGMQALIDISGKLRVVFAAFLAVIARLLGIRGMFYRLAGEQARLIDDASGTLPPYDQFVILGPVCAQETADTLKEKTGYEVAIVDVNDLKRVQILAASSGVDCKHLEIALIDNPAGNADEQTPITLVRGLGVPLNETSL